MLAHIKPSVRNIAGPKLMANAIAHSHCQSAIANCPLPSGNANAENAATIIATSYLIGICLDITHTQRGATQVLHFDFVFIFIFHILFD